MPPTVWQLKQRNLHSSPDCEEHEKPWTWEMWSAQISSALCPGSSKHLTEPSSYSKTNEESVCTDVIYITWLVICHIGWRTSAQFNRPAGKPVKVTDTCLTLRSCCMLKFPSVRLKWAALHFPNNAFCGGKVVWEKTEDRGQSLKVWKNGNINFC